MAVAGASSSSHRLPTYEGSLLVNLSGSRWEEKWCALFDGNLRIYHSRTHAAADPTLVAATYQLSSFDSLQTSGSWGASEGPFELVLSRSSRKQAAPLSRKTSGGAPPSMLPRAATSGSLHALYERSANVISRKGPQQSSDTAAPRFQLQVDVEEESTPPSSADMASRSPPQTSSRLSSWLRLPGRPRVSSINKLSPRSAGSDRALSDRFRRDAAVNAAKEDGATVVVMRASSASSMTRWAEMVSPWLQRSAPAGITSPSAQPASSAQPLDDNEHHAPSASSSFTWGGAMTRVRSRLSITDLLEEAGNNARRRRVESSAGNADDAAAQGEGDETVASPAPRRRLRRLSIETGRRLSMMSINGSSSTSSRPNTASGMSIKSTFGSKRRSVSSVSGSDKRLSVQSDRRASSPMALFNLFKNGSSSGGTADDPTRPTTSTAATHSAPQRYVSTFQPSRAMSPPPDPAQDGSLDEIMGNERRHAMQRFAELRRTGSPTMESNGPIVAATSAWLPFPDAASSGGASTPNSWMSSPPLSSTLSARPKVSSSVSGTSSSASFRGFGHGGRDVSSGDDSASTTTYTGTEPRTPLTPNAIEDATSRFAAFSFKSSTPRPALAPLAAMPPPHSVHRKPAPRVALRDIFPASAESAQLDASRPEPHAPGGIGAGLPSSASMPAGLGRFANKMMRLGTSSGRDAGGGKSPGRICEELPHSSPAAATSPPENTTQDVTMMSTSPAPSPLVVERILPPEVIVSRMDAIGRLDPYAAAEAKRDLRSEAASAATTPSTTPALSSTRPSGMVTASASMGPALGLGIFAAADEEDAEGGRGDKSDDTYRLPTSSPAAQPQSRLVRPRQPLGDVTARNNVSQPTSKTSTAMTKSSSMMVGLPAPPRQMGKKRSAPLLSLGSYGDTASSPPRATLIENRDQAFPSPPRKMAAQSSPRRRRSTAAVLGFQDKENGNNNDDASLMPPPSSTTAAWQAKTNGFSLASHPSLYAFAGGSGGGSSTLSSGNNSRRSSMLSFRSSISMSRRGGHSRHHSLMTAATRRSQHEGLTRSSFGPISPGATTEELHDEVDASDSREEDGLERAGNEWRQWLRRQQHRRAGSVGGGGLAARGGTATTSSSATTSARSSMFADSCYGEEDASLDTAQIYAVRARLRPINVRQALAAGGRVGGESVV